MNNFFYIGTVDHRNDLRCQFSNYILLAASIVIVLIIGVKFVCALQFGSKKDPEDHDKFVICQVFLSFKLQSVYDEILKYKFVKGSVLH
jgi:chitin synthase